MKTTLGALLILSGAAAQAGDACPKLAGLYHCPAHGATPAFEMRVTQSGSLKKIVHYRWEYSQGIQNAGYSASLKGVKNPDGLYAVCRNQGLYLTESLQDLSGSMRNEVTPTGNYVITTFMGEPYQTCSPVSKSSE